MSKLQVPGSALTSGRKTVTTGGTAEKLSATATDGTEIHICALSTNTNPVVFGGSDVVAAAGTRKGISLAAGEKYVLVFNDASKIYLDVVTNGEGVSYIVVG
jgi:hypothetical protein